MTDRMQALLEINNRMMHAADDLRRNGMMAEAARMAELALGVWTIMCSLSKAERGTAEVTS